jgi:hypothetical protein
MAYRSERQKAYFHANKKELEKQGVDVEEWDKASNGLSLPNKVMPKKLKRQLEKHGLS